MVLGQALEDGMGKLMAVLPTGALIGVLGLGWWLHWQGQANGDPLVAMSLAGLGVYPVIAIFVVGIPKVVSGDKVYSISEKWFYGYLIGLEIVAILVALYLMGHN